MDTLLDLLGSSAYTMDYAASYTFWVVVIGGIPAMLSLTMSHLLRSVGYAGQSSFELGMGGIINIVLDPLFMFVLLPEGKQVTGVAIATMLSNVVALCYFAGIFAKLYRSTVLSGSPRLVLSGAHYAGTILTVGVPSAIGNLLSCVSNIISWLLDMEISRWQRLASSRKGNAAAGGLQLCLQKHPAHETNRKGCQFLRYGFCDFVCSGVRNLCADLHSDLHR